MLKLPFVFFPFVQFATNIKMVCDNWNISTALWLRRLENFNSFISGKSPLYSILGNIFVLFQNCIWTMFSPQDPSGVYYVICLAWILSGILYDVFVACTIHRGGKNGKYILACEQALHLGESREFTRELHPKGDVRAASPLARAFPRGPLHSQNWRACSQASIFYIFALLTKLIRLRQRGQDGWVLAKFFLACLWTESKSRSIKVQKRTRPISKHLERTNLF